MTTKTWTRDVYLDTKRIRLVITANDTGGRCNDWEFVTVTVEVKMPAGFQAVDYSIGGYSWVPQGRQEILRVEAQRDRRAPVEEKPVVVDVGDGVQILREV